MKLANATACAIALALAGASSALATGPASTVGSSGGNSIEDLARRLQQEQAGTPASSPSPPAQNDHADQLIRQLERIRQQQEQEQQQQNSARNRQLQEMIELIKQTGNSPSPPAQNNSPADQLVRQLELMRQQQEQQQRQQDSARNQQLQGMLEVIKKTGNSQLPPMQNDRTEQLIRQIEMLRQEQAQQQQQNSDADRRAQEMIALIKQSGNPSSPPPQNGRTEQLIRIIERTREEEMRRQQDAAMQQRLREAIEDIRRGSQAPPQAPGIDQRLIELVRERQLTEQNQRRDQLQQQQINHLLQEIQTQKHQLQVLMQQQNQCTCSPRAAAPPSGGRTAEPARPAQPTPPAGLTIMVPGLNSGGGFDRIRPNPSGGGFDMARPGPSGGKPAINLNEAPRSSGAVAPVFVPSGRVGDAAPGAGRLQLPPAPLQQPRSLQSDPN